MLGNVISTLFSFLNFDLIYIAGMEEGGGVKLYGVRWPD